MLRCRCATFSILKHAEATWLHRRALERASEPLSTAISYVRGCKSLICFIASDQICSRPHSRRLIGLNGMDEHMHRFRYRCRQTTPDNCFIAGHRSRWRHKITDNCFIEDYAEFRQLSNERIVNDMSCDFTPRWAWTSFLHMHPQLDIPESLLQGPWTSDMMEYLFWLIRAEARICWTNSTNGEVWNESQGVFF
jgi:hypothetical protein